MIPDFKGRLFSATGIHSLRNVAINAGFTNLEDMISKNGYTNYIDLVIGLSGLSNVIDGEIYLFNLGKTAQGNPTNPRIVVDNWAASMSHEAGAIEVCYNKLHGSAAGLKWLFQHLTGSTMRVYMLIDTDTTNEINTVIGTSGTQVATGNFYEINDILRLEWLETSGGSGNAAVKIKKGGAETFTTIDTYAYTGLTDVTGRPGHLLNDHVTSNPHDGAVSHVKCFSTNTTTTVDGVETGDGLVNNCSGNFAGEYTFSGYVDNNNFTFESITEYVA